MSSTSEDGRGVLTIRNAIPEDAGAYTCEALNNKGSIFAQPDTIVTIQCKYSCVQFYQNHNSFYQIVRRKIKKESVFKFHLSSHVQILEPGLSVS